MEKLKTKTPIIDINLKKICKDTRKINLFKRSDLNKDQLRNLLERNLISIKEYFLIINIK